MTNSEAAVVELWWAAALERAAGTVAMGSMFGWCVNHMVLACMMRMSSTIVGLQLMALIRGVVQVSICWHFDCEPLAGQQVVRCAVD